MTMIGQVKVEKTYASGVTEIERQDYYYNGFTRRAFKPGPSLDRLLAVLKSLDQGELREGFHWKGHFKDTQDLMPDNFTYDQIFLDFLIEQDLVQLVRDITGEELYFSSTNLRKVYPGSVYMGWHRDTHHYTGWPSAGVTPPIHKLIFYPALGHSPTPQLKVSPGSQLRVSRNKYWDRLQTMILPRKSILNSDSHFVLFNTALFHSTTNVPTPEGCFRLFYHFCNKVQFDQYHRQELFLSHYQKRLEAKNGKHGKLESI